MTNALFFIRGEPVMIQFLLQIDEILMRAQSVSNDENTMTRSDQGSTAGVYEDDLPHAASTALRMTSQLT